MERAVPVTMGSPRFVEREVGAFRVISAFFPPGELLDTHFHDRATFATMLAGGFDLEFTSPALSKRRHPCTPATVLIEPPGETHANHVYESGAQVLVIQPDPEASDLLDPVAGLLGEPGTLHHGGLAAIARRLRRELEHPDSVTPIAIEAFALEMMSVAARLDPKERTPGKPPAWLFRARDYVHEHFRGAPTISDVAEAVDVHPAHLAKVFRREFRVPIGEYIRKLRLDWAAEQLAATEKPIASIAFEAGFSDQSHLTRRLKMATGTTPAAYRRQKRGA